MKDYELFEEMVKRLLDAELLTIDELQVHADALKSIHKKIAPSRGRGRRSQFPSERLIAARTQIIRDFFGDTLTDKRLWELVARFTQQSMAQAVSPAAVREVDRKLRVQYESSWFRENADTFKKRVPDLLPSRDELEKV